MKRCATCNRTYEDSSLNYCLADGAPLVEIASEPTVVIPRPAEKKKSKLLIWVALGVLALGAIVVVLASLLMYKFSGTRSSAGRNNQTERQAASSTSKPRTSPTTAAATPDEREGDEAVDGDATPVPSVAGNDEVTPILWDTTAGGFKGTPGTTYKFECPSDGTARAIFGNDIYTDYSSICTAAVHSGVITLKDGGTITMEYRPGKTIYGSTVRNEITSITTGEHNRSFVIRSKAKE